MMYELVIKPHQLYLEQHIPPSLLEAGQPYNMIFHIYAKPRGYSGDWDLLQKMYVCMNIDNFDPFKGSETSQYKDRWDNYICALPEMLSLKYRFEMFTTQVQDNLKQGCKSLVDLGCGNGFFTRQGANLLGRECRVLGVDNDITSFAKGNPSWLHMNVCKTLPEQQFDMVYSSGLFDYFSDNMFKHVLDGLRVMQPKWIMIGNIQQSVSTKAFMECLGWEIFDRSRWDLLELSSNIFGFNHVRVDTDRTGHQHFLVVTL
jgi:SAM-dependent methyltransferase